MFFWERGLLRTLVPAGGTVNRLLPAGPYLADVTHLPPRGPEGAGLGTSPRATLSHGCGGRVRGSVAAFLSSWQMKVTEMSPRGGLILKDGASLNTVLGGSVLKPDTRDPASGGCRVCADVVGDQAEHPPGEPGAVPAHLYGFP